MCPLRDWILCYSTFVLFTLSAVQSILYSRSLVDKKIPLNLYLIVSKLKSMLIITSGAKDNDRIRSVYAGPGWGSTDGGSHPNKSQRQS